MAQVIRATAKGTLSGTTEGGRLQTVGIDFSLDNQDTHEQVVVTVESDDTFKSVSLPSQPQQEGTKQTLFMMTTTGNVRVRLNNNANLDFTLATNGPFILPGLPEITKIDFTSLFPEEVKVTITKIFGATVLIDPSGAPNTYAPQLDQFSATAGQTDFTLTRAPGSDPVLLFIEGVQYSSPDFFTVSSNVLTWLDNPFVLPDGARVEVYYS